MSRRVRNKNITYTTSLEMIQETIALERRQNALSAGRSFLQMTGASRRLRLYAHGQRRDAREPTQITHIHRWQCCTYVRWVKARLSGLMFRCDISMCYLIGLEANIFSWAVFLICPKAHGGGVIFIIEKSATCLINHSITVYHNSLNPNDVFRLIDPILVTCEI